MKHDCELTRREKIILINRRVTILDVSALLQAVKIIYIHVHAHTYIDTPTISTIFIFSEGFVLYGRRFIPYTEPLDLRTVLVTDVSMSSSAVKIYELRLKNFVDHLYVSKKTYFDFRLPPRC